MRNTIRANALQKGRKSQCNCRSASRAPCRPTPPRSWYTRLRWPPRRQMKAIHLAFSTSGNQHQLCASIVRVSNRWIWLPTIWARHHIMLPLTGMYNDRRDLPPTLHKICLCLWSVSRRRGPHAYWYQIERSAKPYIRVSSLTLGTSY